VVNFLAGSILTWFCARRIKNHVCGTGKKPNRRSFESVYEHLFASRRNSATLTVRHVLIGYGSVSKSNFFHKIRPFLNVLNSFYQLADKQIHALGSVNRCGIDFLRGGMQIVDEYTKPTATCRGLFTIFLVVACSKLEGEDHTSSP
jgi:hypothetical protein